jgi:hypothetical protein
VCESKKGEAENLKKSRHNILNTNKMDAVKPNGKAEPKEAKKLADTLNGIKTAERTLVPGASVPKFTAAERLQRLEVFNKLNDRYAYLKEKAESLAAFKAANTHDQTRFKIFSAGNETFEVSNSEVIAKVLVVLTEELKAKLKSAEAEVLAFEI